MKVQLVYNPVAGQRNIAEDLDQVMGFLRGRGWEVTLRRTLGPGDAAIFAREAAESQHDLVVAVGGDGTLGEVASGLAHSECALGILPIGTGNVWARMLGVPTWTLIDRSALMEAARILVDGTIQSVDIGLVNGKRFLLWTGIGFDAQIAQVVEPHREIRRSFGNLTYLVGAITIGSRLRGTRMTVVIDGKALRQRVILLLITNIQLYGGVLKVAPQAQLDDGLLDVYVFKGADLLDVLRHVITILMGKQLEDPKIEAYQAHHIEIRGDRRLPLQTDGDPAGYLPATVTVEPKALRVVVPKWAPASLFRDGTGLASEPMLAERIAERLDSERERLVKAGDWLRSGWERWLGISSK